MDRKTLFFLLTLLARMRNCSAWFTPEDADVVAEVVPAEAAVLYGEKIEITCTLTTYPHDLNSSSLYFYSPPTPQLPPDAVVTIVDELSISLVIEAATASDDDTYYHCCRRDSSFCLGTAHIRTGALPEPVSEVECISDNHESMRCSICPESDGTSPTRTHMSWKKGGLYPRFGNCSCDREEDCFFNSHDFFKYSKYEMVVTVRNLFGSNTTKHEIVTDESIVKPLPVVSLVATAFSSTSANVSWLHPPRLEPTVMVLEYMLDIHSQWGHNQAMIVQGKTWIYLDNLVPYTNYQFSVRAKPHVGGHWSDGTVTDILMPEDVPGEGPNIPSGGFRMTECSGGKEDCRNVTIFWEDINQSKKHGIIQSYTVNTDPATNLSMAGGDAFSAQLTLAKSQAYSVSVMASTSVEGLSPQGTIALPANTLPHPSVAAESTADGTGLAFYIEPWGAVDNYTLLYCLGDQGARHVCKGKPTVVYLDGNTTEYTREGITPGYVYSVAASRGSLSSGLTRDWLCIYGYDELPGRPKFTIEARQERSLIIHWSALTCDYGSNRGRVQSVHIYFQDEDGEVRNTVVPGKVTEYTLTDLKPYHNYSIYMVAEARAGEGDVTDSQTCLTLESAPEDPPQNVSISDVGRSYITVAWQPTPTPNGRVKYEVEASDGISKAKVTVSGTNATVSDLRGLSNYTITVRATNDAGSSNYSTEFYAQTLVGVPQEVLHVNVTVVSDEIVNVTWQPPAESNGPVHHYEVHKLISSGLNTTVNVTGKTWTTIKMSCFERRDSVSISVAAVNKDPDGTLLTGKPTDQSVEFCSRADSESQPLISIIVGFSVVLLVCVVFVSYCIRRQCKKRMNLPISMPDHLKDLPGLESGNYSVIPAKFQPDEASSDSTSTGTDSEASQSGNSSTRTKDTSVASDSNSTIDSYCLTRMASGIKDPEGPGVRMVYGAEEETSFSDENNSVCFGTPPYPTSYGSSCSSNRTDDTAMSTSSENIPSVDSGCSSVGSGDVELRHMGYANVKQAQNNGVNSCQTEPEDGNTSEARSQPVDRGGSDGSGSTIDPYNRTTYMAVLSDFRAEGPPTMMEYSEEEEG